MKPTPFVAFALLASALVSPITTHAFGERDPAFNAPSATPNDSCGTLVELMADQGVLHDEGLNVVKRLRADGSVDTSWGVNGIATLPVATRPARAYTTVDGGLLVVGQSAVKLRADGSVDTTYGAGGQSDAFWFATRIPETFNTALLPDGSIVGMNYDLVGDGTGIGPSWTFTRVDPNGRLDTTFGTGGKLRVPANLAIEPYAWGVQGDGQIQFAAYSRSAPDILVPTIHRYPNDFAPGEAAGRLVPRDVVASYLSPAATVDAQGRLILAASCQGGACGLGRLVIARFDIEGRPDASWGGGGRALISAGEPVVPETYAARATNLGADGTLTVVAIHYSTVGSFPPNQLTRQRAFRLTDAGVLDARFDNGVVLGGEYPYQGPVVFDDAGRMLYRTYAAPDSGCFLRRSLGDQPRSDARLVEYRYRDRYFVTAVGFESNILDRDPAAEKLRRTGQSFGAWLPASQPPASLPLCRFNGDLAAGPAGHFYTLQGAECDLVRADDVRLPRGTRTWRYEGLAFNEAPTSTSGTCPPNLQPVRRLYNNAAQRGVDPNHRFAIDPAVIAQMQAEGWTLEGVAFCAPPTAR